MSYAEARRRMVDGQLRPNRVTDPRLIEILRTIPREEFLPPELRSRAYLDGDVPLPETAGRVLMQPLILARLVQMAAPRAEDRALVLGAGTGYGAAVLAAMGTRVTAVEPEPALRAIAEAGFAAAGLWAGAVRLVAASPREGLAEAGPHDVILIEGAIPAVPEVIAGQLAEAGRLATVVAETAGTGRGVLGRRIGGAFTLLPVFDCATAALPAFAREPGFVF